MSSILFGVENTKDFYLMSFISVVLLNLKNVPGRFNSNQKVQKVTLTQELTPPFSLRLVSNTKAELTLFCLCADSIFLAHHLLKRFIQLIKASGSL